MWFSARFFYDFGFVSVLLDMQNRGVLCFIFADVFLTDSSFSSNNTGYFSTKKKQSFSTTTKITVLSFTNLYVDSFGWKTVMKSNF